MQKEEFLKETGKMKIKKELSNMNIKMELYMKVTGKIIISMEKVLANM